MRESVSILHSLWFFVLLSFFSEKVKKLKLPLKRKISLIYARTHAHIAHARGEKRQKDKPRRESASIRRSAAFVCFFPNETNDKRNGRDFIAFPLSPTPRVRLLSSFAFPSRQGCGVRESTRNDPADASFAPFASNSRPRAFSKRFRISSKRFSGRRSSLMQSCARSAPSRRMTAVLTCFHLLVSGRLLAVYSSRRKEMSASMIGSLPWIAFAADKISLVVNESAARRQPVSFLSGICVPICADELIVPDGLFLPSLSAVGVFPFRSLPCATFTGTACLFPEKSSARFAVGFFRIFAFGSHSVRTFPVRPACFLASLVDSPVRIPLSPPL